MAVTATPLNAVILLRQCPAMALNATTMRVVIQRRVHPPQPIATDAIGLLTECQLPTTKASKSFIFIF